MLNGYLFYTNARHIIILYISDRPIDEKILICWTIITFLRSVRHEPPNLCGNNSRRINFSHTNTLNILR